MAKISWHFRRRRGAVWVTLALLLGGFYATRLNLSMMTTMLRERLGLARSDYGALTSAGLIAFAVSSLLTGPLVDRLGGKRALYLGIAGSVAFNLMMGLGLLLVSSPAVIHNGQMALPPVLRFGLTPATFILLLTVLWIGNNIFQGIGLLSPFKILVAWFRTDERGLFAGIFKLVTHAVHAPATIMIPLFISMSWEYTFWGPAAMLVVLGLMASSLVKETPSQAGFDELESSSGFSSETPLRIVFTKAAPWVIAVCILCMSVVKSAIEYWFARYLSITFEIPSAELSEFLPYECYSVAIGFAGSWGLLAVGYAADRFLKYGRVALLSILLVGQTLSLLFLWQVLHNAWMAAIAAVIISFFAQAGLMLAVTVLGMDIGRRRAVATTMGFFTFVNYVGAYISSACLGRLLDHYRDAAHHGVEFAVWPLWALSFAGPGTLLSVWLWYRGRSGPLASSL